ncbi:MAG: hypothetical protein U5K79_18275 [Cyclobacteriaceae bacterium]|nr:hypothetical protein [Cyclobacteriaceae bacterium]
MGLGQLLKYPTNPEEEKEILSKIINNTYELDEVVKDLNKILDIQYNTAKIWVNVDLGLEMDNVLSSLRREIVETEAIVNADFSACGSIHSVKTYINSILLNLVSNAIKIQTSTKKAYNFHHIRPVA